MATVEATGTLAVHLCMRGGLCPPRFWPHVVGAEMVGATPRPWGSTRVRGSLSLRQTRRVRCSYSNKVALKQFTVTSVQLLADHSAHDTLKNTACRRRTWYRPFGCLYVSLPTVDYITCLLGLLHVCRFNRKTFRLSSGNHHTSKLLPVNNAEPLLIKSRFSPVHPASSSHRPTYQCRHGRRLR